MEKQELIALGTVIREKREAQELTQHELAERANVDSNYIGMVERGERNPSCMSLIKIAAGLGMPVYKMLKP